MVLTLHHSGSRPSRGGATPYRSHSDALDTRSGAIVFCFFFFLLWLSWSDQRRAECTLCRQLAMGAQGSSQRDGKIQEDASASASGGELSAEVKVLQEGSSVLDGKVTLILTPAASKTALCTRQRDKRSRFHVCKHTYCPNNLPQCSAALHVRLFLLSNGSTCLQSRSNKTPACSQDCFKFTARQITEPQIPSSLPYKCVFSCLKT